MPGLHLRRPAHPLPAAQEAGHHHAGDRVADGVDQRGRRIDDLPDEDDGSGLHVAGIRVQVLHRLYRSAYDPVKPAGRHPVSVGVGVSVGDRPVPVRVLVDKVHRQQQLALGEHLLGRAVGDDGVVLG